MLYQHSPEEYIDQLVPQQLSVFIEQDLLGYLQQLVEAQELVLQHAFMLEERDE